MKESALALPTWKRWPFSSVVPRTPRKPSASPAARPWPGAVTTTGLVLVTCVTATVREGRVKPLIAQRWTVSQFAAPSTPSGPRDAMPPSARALPTSEKSLRSTSALPSAGSAMATPWPVNSRTEAPMPAPRKVRWLFGGMRSVVASV